MSIVITIIVSRLEFAAIIRIIIELKLIKKLKIL